MNGFVSQLIGPYAVGDMPKNNVLAEPINIFGEDHSAELKGSCTNSSMILVAGPPAYGEKTIDILGGSPMISK